MMSTDLYPSSCSTNCILTISNKQTKLLTQKFDSNVHKVSKYVTVTFECTSSKMTSTDSIHPEVILTTHKDLQVKPSKNMTIIMSIAKKKFT